MNFFLEFKVLLLFYKRLVIIIFRSDHPFEEVIIAVVGKYTQFEDSYMSVIKALKHSALSIRRTLSINVSVIFHVPSVCWALSVLLLTKSL